MKTNTTQKWLSLFLILGILNTYSNNKVKGLTNLSKTTKTKTLAANVIADLLKNKIIPLVNGTGNFTGVTVSTTTNTFGSDDFDNTGRAIDNSFANYSRAYITVVGGSESLTVTSPINFPAGSYAGFSFKSSALLGLNAVIKLKNSLGVVVGTYSPSSSLLNVSVDLLSSTSNIGFIAPAEFKSIEITFSGLAATVDVYNAFIKVYEENTTPLDCNTITEVTNTQYPLEIDDFGVSGISLGLLGSAIKNPEYVIDASQSNYAVLNGAAIGVGIAAETYLSVKKQKDFTTGNVTNFVAGTYAGFNITTANLVSLGILDNIVIETYLNNVLVETSDKTAGNVIDLPLINSDNQNVGFITSLAYDEIKITVAQTAGVTLGEVRVNYPIIKKYCPSTALTCNERVALTNTNFPVEVHAQGNLGLVSVGGSIDNLNNIINADTTDYAELGLSATVASTLEIGVYDVLQDYTGPHFVGFEIETASLVGVNLLDNITLATYLNGVATGDSETGVNGLLSVPLLAYSNKRTIGFVTTNNFDEVRIQFNSTVGVNLGVVKIYNSVIQKMCPKVIGCNETYFLNLPEFSSYIDFKQTGVSGLACVGCEVTNSGAVLSASDSDFASINITAGVAAAASLAVRDATNTYPLGSYAGFIIKSNSSAIELNLFKSLTIQTLDQNGAVLETKSGSDLLGLTLLQSIIGSHIGTVVNVGFKTNQAYAGLKITASQLIDVNTSLSLGEDNDLEIYGTFVDTRGATGGDFDACFVDADSDGIVNSLDLDDDNDGILDTDENICAGFQSVSAADLSIPNNSTNYNMTEAADVSANFGLALGSVLIQGFSVYTNNSGKIVVGSGAGSDQTRFIITGSIPVRIKGTHGKNIGANGMRYDAIEALDGVSYTFTTAVLDPGFVSSKSGNDYYVTNTNITSDNENTDLLTWESDAFASRIGFFTNGGSVNSVIVLSLCPATDTDKDGIPNHLDLDSDGDGCPDSMEAGVQIVLKAADITNGNGTDASANTTASKANGVIDIMAPGQSVGNNGLVASLESDDTVNATTSYASTYAAYALDKNINACGTAMITQVFQSAGERWIEVTNIDANNIVAANTANIAFFKNVTQDPVNGQVPIAEVVNSTVIAAGESILIASSGTVTNKLPAAAITENASVTDFDGANDVIALTRGISSKAWDLRLDVVKNIADSTSYVRIDNVSSPNTTFDSVEWVAFINDNIITYTDLAEDAAIERHPHDPLLSEIALANVNANIKPGLHNFGLTDRISGAWSNGYPDRSREVKVSESYNHLEKLSARNLEIRNGSIFSVTDHLLVVTNNVNIDTANDQIRLISTDDTNKAQLIQTHTGVKQVTGLGKLLVDQTSKVPNMYRYDYMSSPVNTLGANDYTLESVLKDGTNVLTHSGAIGQGATDLAKDINFVSGYNGSPTAPISVADYWVYTYASSDGGRSNWEHKNKNGIIPQTDGYIFKGPTNEQNYTFVGTPKDGDLITNVGKEQSYLVGNPFSGAINAKKFIQDNTSSITGSLYFWEHAGEDSSLGDAGHYYGGYIGGYAIRNISMGLSANQVMTNNGADSVINLVEAENCIIDNGLDSDSYTDAVYTGISGVILNSVNENLSFNSAIAADEIFISYRSASVLPLGIKVDGGSLQVIQLEDSNTGYKEGSLNIDIKVGDLVEVIYNDNAATTGIYIDSFTLKRYVVNEGIPHLGGGDYKVPAEYIAMGQGFFIEGDATDGGAIVFNNSQREYKTEGVESVFYKGENKSKVKREKSLRKLPIIKLGINYISEEGLGLHRQIGISFKSGNSFGFDNGYDAAMFDVGDTDFYWKFPDNDEKYAITGVQEISDDLEVPLYVSLANGGTVAIGIDEWEAIDKDVYIKDKLTDKTYLLNNGRFSLTLASGSYTDRFFLTFKEGTTLGVSNNATVLNKNITVFLDSNTKEIVINNEYNLQLKSVELFNLLGQKMGQWNNLDQVAKQQRLKTTKLSKAIYIINIETEKGKVSKKLILE